MSKFNNIENIIIPIMMNDPKARDDDNYLFIEYLKLVKPELINMSFYDAMINHGNELNFRSVIRVRAKLQAKYPEYRGKVYEKRHKNSKEFRDYVKEM